MGSWDEQHRLRLRAERASVLLRALWGDEPPPGPNAELITLIDAIAGDDAHGQQDHLVCQVDGLTYETFADLLLLARAAGTTAQPGPPVALDRKPKELDCPANPSAPPPTGRIVGGADVQAAIPPSLLARLLALGLLESPGSGSGSGHRETTSHTAGGSGVRPGDDGLDQGAGPASPDAPPSPTATPGAQEGFDTAATGVWELDPATGIVAFDDVAAQLIGAGTTAGSDLLDRHLQDLIHPDDRWSVAQGMQECLRTGTPFLNRFRACSPSGHVTWLISQGRVIHNPTDTSPRLTGFVTLDRRSAQAADVEVFRT